MAIELTLAEPLVAVVMISWIQKGRMASRSIRLSGEMTKGPTSGQEKMRMR